MGLFSGLKKLAGPVLQVAGLVTGNPALSAAGSVISGVQGASAANKEANAQVAAAQQAGDLQK
jgi:hypothetical protein